ncbi:SbcC/MukB-like Walker B domain-containing protein [Cupriavidus yeoncheonensis]|nr:SbcC/MukB-like Walker B domain-containing protein [Cupriavidus yeoncheonensis]
MSTDLSATEAHQWEFEQRYRQLKAICDEDSIPVSTASAHACAIALDTKLRNMRADGKRVPELELDRFKASRASDQQAKTRRAAAELGIDSGMALLEASATLRREISEREASQQKRIARKTKLLDEQAQVQQALLQLTEADKCYRQGSEYRQQLCEWDADRASIEDRFDLEDARQNISARLVAASDRRRELEKRLRELSESIRSLRSSYGTIDPLVGSVAEHLDGDLVASQFEELDIETAARTQARLGQWTEAIVVENPEAAAKEASMLEVRPDNLLFVRPDYAPTQQLGISLEDSELVGDGVDCAGVRLTRRPDRPILGRRAREAEASRLEEEKAKVEKNLSDLRTQSGSLQKMLEIADRCLALPAAAWREDPGPALEKEHERDGEIRTNLSEVDTGLTRDRIALATALDRKQQLAELEPNHELLDPPLYADVISRLDSDLRICREAASWMTRFSDRVEAVVQGIPVLNLVPDTGRIAALNAAVAELDLKRRAEARAGEALGALLTVAADLQFAGDEKLHKQKSGVMEALSVRRRKSEVRLNVATFQLEAANDGLDAARQAENERAGKHHVANESHKHLAGELQATGLAGTPEERDVAKAALDAAEQALKKTQSEGKAVSTEAVRVEEQLRRLVDDHLRAKNDLALRLRAWRSERVVKRELEAEIARQALAGKINSEINRQEILQGRKPTTRLFDDATRHKGTLLERLKAHADVVQAVSAFDDHNAGEDQLALQTLRIWACVLAHIEARIPRNIASSDEPRVALAQMREKLVELHRTLQTQEKEMRNRSTDVSRGIASLLRTVATLVIRLNRELEHVKFGSISGIHIEREEPPMMAAMLAALKEDGGQSLFDTDATLDDTLSKLYERVGGGRIKGSELLDYRNYVTLRVKVRRLTGAWDSATGLSTGEAIGVGAAILVMILRTWNEVLRRISGASAGHCMQQILLDEAQRLDAESLDTLTEFCQAMDVQALVAGPALEEPRSATIFSLVRKLYNGRELVTFEGRRLEWTGKKTA